MAQRKLRLKRMLGFAARVRTRTRSIEARVIQNDYIDWQSLCLHVHSVVEKLMCSTGHRQDFQVYMQWSQETKGVGLGVEPSADVRV